MRLSTPVKICVAALCLSPIFAGCSLWRSNDNSASFAASQPRIELPFSTREPEIFQADVITRTGEVERRITIAREGSKRRIDYDPDTDHHRAILMTSKEYVIDFKAKRVTEREPSGGTGQNELLSHLLHVRDYAEFDEIRRDGTVVQFRARINESKASEAVIFFDESIGLPVKQEFYSLEGGQRVLRYTVELRNFKKEVDPGVFEIPGFKVSR